MHPAAREYVARYATQRPVGVAEIGSRNINGTVRDLFPNAYWFGLDLRKGPCVDLVCDAETWKPDIVFDLVVCCEVLEHAENWKNLIAAAVSWLAPGGRLIVTCAGEGRKPHSGIDGGDVPIGEYYRNVSVAELCREMQKAGIWIDSAETVGEDTRASGTTSRYKLQVSPCEGQETR